MTQGSKHTNLQKHATEKAALTELLQNVNRSATELKDSLKTYIDATYISPTAIPADINGINEVLKRFYETHKIDDLNDLVSNHPDLINEAILFARNPSTNEFRASYNRVESALKLVNQHRHEYNAQDTYIKISGSKDGKKSAEPVSISNHDGFQNYMAKASKITALKSAFDRLLEYTKGSKLNANDLPQSVKDLQQTIKALPAPGAKVDPKTQTKDQSKLPTEGQRFEVGSEEDLALHNKAVYDAVVLGINNDKMACFEAPLLKRMEYNKCVRDNTENVDAKCAAINTQYETAKANCESHYPMVTISDAVMENLFADIEKLHATFEGGQYIVDNTDAVEAVGGYITMLETVNKMPLAIASGVEYETGQANIPTIAKSIEKAVGAMGFDTTYLPQIAASAEMSGASSNVHTHDEI